MGRLKTNECNVGLVNAAIAAVDARLPKVDSVVIAELIQLELGNIKTIYSGLFQFVCSCAFSAIKSKNFAFL